MLCVAVVLHISHACAGSWLGGVTVVIGAFSPAASPPLIIQKCAEFAHASRPACAAVEVCFMRSHRRKAPTASLLKSKRLCLTPGPATAALQRPLDACMRKTSCMQVARLAHPMPWDAPPCCLCAPCVPPEGRPPQNTASSTTAEPEPAHVSMRSSSVKRSRMTWARTPRALKGGGRLQARPGSSLQEAALVVRGCTGRQGPRAPFCSSPGSRRP